MAANRRTTRRAETSRKPPSRPRANRPQDDSRETPKSTKVTPGENKSDQGGARRVAGANRKKAASSTVLRESDERFRLTADAAPVLIWMSGADKLCTWFNKPWLNFTGRPMEQELGNGWTENIHADDFDRCLKTYTTAFDSRRP